MRKPKVLMLGWEFPPEISGGLGIANYNLCKALAPLVDLTLILPRNVPAVDIPGVRIIDLSRLKIEEVFEEDVLKEFEKVVREKKIDFSFSPYPEKRSKPQDRTIKVQKKEKQKRIVELHNRFAGSELYGRDIMDKVSYYTELIDRLAPELSFDIIHIHDWMTCPAGMLLKKKFNKPLVLHIHSLNYDRMGPEEMNWIYEMEKRALREADTIIPVSHYSARVIREFYKVKPKKISPIHNGIEQTRAFRSDKNFPEHLVLFMGRITMQKGPEYFLEAAMKVMEDLENVRFAVAGDGDKLQEIIESGNYVELGNKIHFTGFLNRKEVQHLLSITDVFCMPSVSEPFGLVALEAVQFGIPVIVSKRSGVAEVLHGAIEVDFWDTDNIAGNIIELLKDKKRYERCVDQGYKDIRKLTWSATAKKVSAVYQSLLTA